MFVPKKWTMRGFALPGYDLMTMAAIGVACENWISTYHSTFGHHVNHVDSQLEKKTTSETSSYTLVIYNIAIEHGT